MVLNRGSLFSILVGFALIFIVVYTLVVPRPEVTVSIPNSSVPVYLEQDESLLYANATILEVLSGHAWQGHGTEVNDAIKCLNNNGSTRSFKTFGFKDTYGKDVKTNLWMCFDGTDWYAIVTTTLEKVGGNRIGRLITAYMVDPKKFMVIDDFITAVKNKWNAVEINFIIEAGSVFLQPR